MSSYLSQPYQIQQPQESVNVQLVGQTLNNLQTRYDTNKAYVDQTLAKYKMLRGLSTSDNEYTAAKVSEAEAVMKEYSRKNGDLSLSTNRDSLLSALDGVYNDPIVQNAIQNKAVYDKYNTEVSKRKEKGDGSYNDLNYQYGLAKGGVNDYMQGKTKKLSNLSYTPYTDYKKTTMEKAIKFKQLKGDQEIQVPDANNPGYMIKTKISGLTPEEIVNYFPDMLDANETKQMAIEGWGMLSGASPEVIKQQADSFFNTAKAGLSKKIEMENAIFNSSTSTEQQKQEALRLKNSYTAQLTDFQNKENSMDKTDPEQVGYMLNRQGFMNSAANLFSGRKSVTYEVDDKYYKDIDLANKEREYQLDLAKYDMSVVEHNAKMKKDYGVNPDGTKSQDNLWKPSPEAGQKLDEPSEVYTGAKEAYNTSYNNIINATQGAYNDKLTTDNHRKIFEEKLKKDNYEIRNGKIVSTISNNPMSKASAAESAFKESGMYNINYGDSNYEKVISDNAETRGFLGRALMKAEKQMSKDFDTDSFVNDFDNVKSALTTFSPTRIFDFEENLGVIGAIADPITRISRENNKGNTPEEQRREDVSVKMDKLIKDNGGKENLRKKVKSNPSLLIAMKSLLDEAATVDSAITTGISFGNPTEATKKVVDALEKEGIRPFIKTKMSVNIPTEQERENIVNLLPQQLNDKDGNPTALNSATFDIKKPITVVTGNEYIDIVQDKGMNAKGVALPQAKQRVFKGTPAYNAVMENMSTETGFKLDAKVLPSSYSIKASVRPKFVNASDEVIHTNLISRYQTNVNQKLKTQLRNEIGVDPAVFFTTRDTKLYLRSTLPKTVTDAQIDTFVSNVENNFDKYRIELQPNNGQNWVVKIDSPKSGETTKYLSRGSELDLDYMYIVKNMPQLLIMKELTKQLIEDPEKIDRL